MSAAETVDILLVDDEARNLDALESILAGPAYRLLRAQNADQALRLLLDNQVAAIVLDIKMPEVSGFELARMIKNTRRFRETPIVFLTAYMVDDADVIAGYGAGGVDYLTKPIKPEILRHKIAVFADLYRKTRELAELNARLADLNETLEARVKERTAELEKSEAALRAAGEQKDDFIAILAHELRNPLAPLQTGLDVLSHHLPGVPPPPVARALAAMSRQLAYIVRLIDDLLDVSRINRGLLDLKRGEVELFEIIHDTVESARPAFERRGQRLSIEADEGMIAHADQTRIAQILSNLLHNAGKFTPKGGAVKVALRSEGESAVIEVTDSGTGISPDDLGRVFEMFVRIDVPGVKAEPGLGVGLALARRLAEMHGGTLTARSAGAGLGSTFTLSIPMQPAASAVATVLDLAADPELGPPLNIVVVEDNEDIADGLADLLTALGHRVSIAMTGTQGVQVIQQSRPDLVLCDIGLPELNGLDVCREVRANFDHQPMMVALTGYNRKQDMDQTKAAGFDRHLVKPINEATLSPILKVVGEGRARAGGAANSAP